MKFVCYHQLDQLPDSANALFENAGKKSLFFSRPWFENLVKTVEKDQSVVLACVVAGSKVLAILPLVRGADNNYQSLKHRYTTHYSLIIEDEYPWEVITCLGQGLLRLPVRSLLLEPVARDDYGLSDLRKCMEDNGYRCEQFFRFYNWILKVQDQSYQTYMKGRPARLRNTIMRKRRKLDREHGCDIRLFTGKSVTAAMPDYYTVYTASWKANEQYTGFVDGMVKYISDMGWSRMAILYVNNLPIAAQLWFVLHGKASIFRLSYDEEWKRYSPGSILTSFLMEYVIDTDKVEEIDFLTGNDAYKQDWMSDRRERYALSCVKEIMPDRWYKQVFTRLKKWLPGK